jgi:hypothetical protein
MTKSAKVQPVIGGGVSPHQQHEEPAGQQQQNGNDQRYDLTALHSFISFGEASGRWYAR